MTLIISQRILQFCVTRKLTLKSIYELAATNLNIQNFSLNKIKSEFKENSSKFTSTSINIPVVVNNLKNLNCGGSAKIPIRIMSAINKSLPNIVFVLGGPGAGKGTQCSKIVETFGFVHLSAGDLLREERNKEGSEYGELIEKHIRDGTIVPVEITCSLLERAMTENGSNLFLIDGFPRNQNNLDGWDRAMSEKVNVLFVLFFDAPEEICVERCLSRGQMGSGRSDDNPESLKKRVFTYMNDTMPIVTHFMGKNLVRKVDASASPDLVFDEVKTIFNQVLNS